MEKIRVLVIDDSAIVRDVLSGAIASQPDMELVGTAPDPFVGRDKIVRDKPDVVTLDIEMPRMDGLTFLERLMHFHPLPVIIVSSITTKDPYAAIKALELGAFDVVNKPGGSLTVEEVKEEVLRKIRQAFDAREDFLRKWWILAEKTVSDLRTTTKKGPQIRSAKKQFGFSPQRMGQTPNLLTQLVTTEKLIAIGASTGGTVALETIFRTLPQNLPPIVVVQHMPEGFTTQFAQRLNELCELRVKEGEEEELLEAGTVYIAPGGYHMEVVRRGASMFLHLHKGERIQFQRPAVDVLFRSVAKQVGKNALGILLTGMGKDGAEGLLAMRQSGAITVAQDEASSIVWGMPKAAIDLNAALRVLSLEGIPETIIQFARGTLGGEKIKEP
ncbi:MAG: chemotaxis response regulator protein-glutamate methylesterase [Spirochaetes bacterium]|nr:chemotaxis response regulator protein-glutamate methylesterase [Spirochaetota bacterium]